MKNYTPLEVILDKQYIKDIKTVRRMFTDKYKNDIVHLFLGIMVGEFSLYMFATHHTQIKNALDNYITIILHLIYGN